MRRWYWHSVFVSFALFLAFAILSSLPATFSYHAMIGPCSEQINNQTVFQAIAHSMGINTLPPQQYQRFNDPCHLLYTSTGIAQENYTLPNNTGVQEIMTLYHGVLYIPLKQRVALTTPYPPLSLYYPPNFNNTWVGIEAINATTHRLLWREGLGNATDTTPPVVVNNTVFMGTGGMFVDSAHYRNGIFAINATTGKIIWRINTTAQHMPQFVYYNNSILVVPGEGALTDNFSTYLYALNATTGKPAWRIFINGSSGMSSPSLVGDMMYFGISKYALSYGNGSSMAGSILSAEGGIEGTPAGMSSQPGEGNASIAEGASVEYAVNLDTHRIAWETTFNTTTGSATDDSSPAVWNNIVVSNYGVAVNDTGNIENHTMRSYLVGLNASTGRILWTLDEGIGKRPPRISTPGATIYNGTIYVDNVIQGLLRAVNLTTGKELWTFKTGIEDPNPTVVDNHVLAINQTGTLFVLDMNGTLVKEMNLGLLMGWCCTPQIQVMGSEIVIGGGNGKVVVLPISGVVSATQS